MMPSSSSEWDTKTKITEQWYHNQLPQHAILEIPTPILLNLDYRAREVKADFQFVLEDLIDDAVSHTTVKDSSQESMEEWFDEVNHHLVAEDWIHDAALEYMNAVGELFDNLKTQMSLLYTPSGNHYYRFTDWVDSGKTTILLTKRAYVG